jgi:hypothetical protein
MNPTAIAMLRYIKAGISVKKELMNKLEIKLWQLDNLIKELIILDYIETRDGEIYLKNNAKTILFRDVENKYDVTKLLADSNELVFRSLIESRDIASLQKITRLSQATLYRSLSDLESIGVLTKDKDGIVKLNTATNDSLYLFAKILNVEKSLDDVKQENSAEVIYQDDSVILKSVTKGKILEGELTAFSLFSDYGIEYHTVTDYYVEQGNDLRLEDVLVHSIMAAMSDNDKNGIIMAIIFYVKNKDKMDLLEIKKIARSFGRNKVYSVWIDIENFLRHNPIENEILPNWDEFESKASLYGIPKVMYELPNAFPEFFEELSKHISSDISVYLIGGENMRIKKLKARTKDCDLAVDNDVTAEILSKALTKMGYQSKDSKSYSKDDLRVKPFSKFIYPGRSDIEIFHTDIARKFYLSSRIKKRAELYRVFGNDKKLKLYLVSNEDIFLLKSITDREGDFFDMVQLVQRGEHSFDWKIVWDELQKQEADLKKHFYSVFWDGIEDFKLKTGIKPPFYKKLIHRAVDELICKIVVQFEPLYMDEVNSYLQGDDISEQLIRNRLASLQRRKLVRQFPSQIGRVLLRGRKSVRMNFHKEKDLLERKYYVNYYSVSKSLEEGSNRLYYPSDILDALLKTAETVCDRKI